MKVSIISDTHFGYKWGSDREEDTFENAREAFKNSLDADVIILPGDIFDKKIPKQEVLDRAAEVLSEAMEGSRTVEADQDLGMHGEGIPVVAIHGTHERRPSDYTNPIELMDKTGHLKHINNEKIVFEKDGEKLAVHGMGGVPEHYAPDVMEKYSPEPVEDAFNILVVHQSIEGFVYTPEDEEFLTLEDFPDGFDMVVDGHIHWYNIERFPSEDGEVPLIFPGSTVTTQMRKIEAEKDKGFLMLDTKENDLEFVPLENPRDVHYIEIDVDGEDWSEVKQRARERLEEVADPERKPLVNLKLQGKTEGRVNPRELKKMFHSSMYLNVNSSVDGVETEKVELQETDALEEGMKVLEDKLDSDLKMDHDSFFQLLENGKPSEAEKMLKEAEE